MQKVLTKIRAAVMVAWVGQILAGSCCGALREFSFSGTVDRAAGPPPFNSSVFVGAPLSGRFVIDEQTSSLAPFFVSYNSAPFIFEASIGDYVFSASDFRVGVYDNELGLFDVYSIETMMGTINGPSTAVSGSHFSLGLHGPTTIYAQSFSTVPADFSLYTDFRTLDLGNIRATITSLVPVPEPSTIALGLISLFFVLYACAKQRPQAEAKP